MTRRIEITDEVVCIDGDDLPSVIHVVFEWNATRTSKMVTVSLDDDDDELALPISKEEATQIFDANELGPVS